MAGIMAGEAWPGIGRLIYFPIVFLVWRILTAARREQPRRWSPLLLFAALGYLAISPWADPDLPDHHVSRFADDAAWELVGTVVERPWPRPGDRKRFVIRAEKLETDEASHPVVGRLRVTARVDEVPVTKGDRVRFTGRIRRPRGFQNPGGFDYARYMAFQGIWATTYVHKGTLRRTPVDDKGSRGSRIAAHRARIATLFETAGTPDAQAVLTALVVGDRSRISEGLRESFNRAGIAHLLAISGLHVGIVATVSFWLCRWAMSWIPALLHRAWTRKGAALLTVVPVLGYGLLAGMSPSTQRAVTMVGVFLAALWIERDAEPINTLAVAAVVILVIYPPSLFSISFQLSFAAVAVILYGHARLGRRRSIEKDSWHAPYSDRLRAFLLVSLLAILGTLPILMRHFHLVSRIGLVTNPIFVPWIGFGVVPAGLSAAALQPVWPGGAELLAAGALFLTDAALPSIRFFARQDAAAVETVIPSMWEIGLYYLLLAGLIELMAAGRDSKRESGRRRGAAIMVSVALAGAAVDILYWVNQRYWKTDLTVTAISVGQGSATLLELPGGDCMLIDGGGFYDNAIFDVGESVVGPLLRRKKIRTVETLVLTHPNSDHLNGLIHIADHFNVQRIWTNGEAADTEGYADLMTAIDEAGIRMVPFQRLPRSRTINGVEVDILYPPPDFIRDWADAPWRDDENNNSLVVRVAFGEVSFLFPGDLMAPAELDLCKRSKIGGLDSTVLMAPHHGSRTSSTPNFLDHVDPSAVVISCGWKNRFHFPHPSVITRYRRRGYRIYRTDRDGAIRMRTDGRHLEITPAVEPPS
jgi:competence protein ComEC